METTHTAVAEFKWLSPLGYSVMLFLLINFIYFMTAVLTPIAFRLYGPELTQRFGLVFSPRTDLLVFGNDVDAVRKQPAVIVTKVSIYDMISGMHLAIAILHFCLVWFCLRAGQEWSLWALTFADLSIVAGFLLATYNFSSNLTPLRFSDLAPYAILPAMILPLAALLGWIGLR